jgi:5-methylcytosine-specific restriction protein A
MPSYILTWNPKKWHWDEKEYEREVRATAKGQLFTSRWSCGKTKRILPGDRVYLLRQDSERGIIGSGYAISPVIEEAHWDKSKSEKALYVKYQSDTLLAAVQRMPVERLLDADLGIHWNNIMASGISVPEEVAPELEKLWKKHLTSIGRQTIKPIIFPEEPGTLTYLEGTVQHVLMNAYERNPQARAACLAHYGPRCTVCDFDFGEVYGELGEGYIHVHHLRDLATIRRQYSIDPVKDLRPVCPNCHAMLHQTTPAMKVEKLKALITKRNR